MYIMGNFQYYNLYVWWVPSVLGTLKFVLLYTCKPNAFLMRQSNHFFFQCILPRCSNYYCQLTFVLEMISWIMAKFDYFTIVLFVSVETRFGKLNIRNFQTLLKNSINLYTVTVVSHHPLHSRWLPCKKCKLVIIFLIFYKIIVKVSIRY